MRWLISPGEGDDGGREAPTGRASRTTFWRSHDGGSHRQPRRVQHRAATFLIDDRVSGAFRGEAVVEVVATVDGLAVLAAVDPVPWARAQMAFTLMFHIILVPLGVSWAFMTLIANYRAVKHGDRDALVLAQRWSKYMAVTFAVGAVTGTVLSFEFGLLWPRFMGQWGAAFGVPFGFEGVFFFTEAIFVAIYIFGWRRLKPWAHFWTGVPDRPGRDLRKRVGGRGQRVDERAVGLHAERRRRRGRRRPDQGDLQRRDAAAGGAHARRRLSRRWIPRRLGVRHGHAARAAWTATTGWGSSSRSVSRRSPHRSRWASETRWPAGCTPTSRSSSPRSSSCPPPSSDVPETLLGQLNDNGTVSGGIPIPGLASWLSDPSTGRSTVVQGLNSVPADDGTDRRSGQHRPSRLGRHGRAWERCCSCCPRGTAVSWIFRRRMPTNKLFLAGGGRLGCPGRDRHGGGLDRDRGRPPAVDRLQHHEGRGRGHRQHRGLDLLRRGRRALPRGGRHHDPRPARHEQAVPPSGRLRRPRCALRAERAARGDSPTPEEAVR